MQIRERSPREVLHDASEETFLPRHAAAGNVSVKRFKVRSKTARGEREKEQTEGNLLLRAYLAVTLLAVLPHEVDSVAVFIPEGALVGEGAICDGDVVVVVVGGEGSTLVVGHGVAWRGEDGTCGQ